MERPNYRKLLIWKKAHQNALSILNIIPDNKIKYSKVFDQCIASATSIGANIAEGNSGLLLKEKARYFNIALKSAYEFDNWIQVLIDSGIIDNLGILKNMVR